MVEPKAVPVSLSLGLATLLLLLARLAVPQTVRMLEMSPAGTLVRGMLWTPLTTGLVEEASLKALLMIGLTVAGGFNVEPQVGSKEFALHIFVAQALASGVAILISVVIYAATYNEDYFFSPIIGLAGVDAAILVLIAATPAVAATRIPSVDLEARLTIIPFLLAYSAASVALLGLRHSDVLLLWPSFLFSVRRITTAEFGMESLFPEALRPAVKAVFAKACRFWPLPIPSEGGEQGADSKLPPISTDSVAERRRARALKALDRKLAEMEAEPDIPLDVEMGGKS